MSTNIKEIQQIQLSILKEIINVVEENHLTYFAVGGTALGAYRHEGFIPWDDDIDIAMPRVDYEKLLTLQSTFPEDLFIQTTETDPNYTMPFAKIRKDKTLYIESRWQDQEIHHGIWVDIFPLDNYKEGDLEWEKQVRKYDHIYRRLNKRYTGLKKFKATLYSMIYSPKKYSKQKLLK